MINRTLLHIDKISNSLINHIRDQHIMNESIYTLRSNKSGLIAFSNDKHLIDFLKDEHKGHEILYALNILLEEDNPSTYFYTSKDKLIPLGLIDYINDDYYKLEMFGRTIYLYSDINKFLDNFKHTEECSYTVIMCDEPIIYNDGGYIIEYPYFNKITHTYKYFYIIFKDVIGEIILTQDQIETIITRFLINKYGDSVKSNKEFNTLFNTVINKREIIVYIKEQIYRDEGISLRSLFECTDKDFNLIVKDTYHHGKDDIQFGVIYIPCDDLINRKYLYLIGQEDVEYLMSRAEFVPMLNLDNIMTTLLYEQMNKGLMDDDNELNDINKDYYVRFIRVK